MDGSRQKRDITTGAVSVRIGLGLALVASVPFWLDQTDLARDPGLALLNVFPWWVIATAGFALTRRPLASSLLTVLLALAVYSINELKLRNLGLPLIPADAAVLPQILDGPRLFLRYIESGPWLVPAVMLTLMLVWLAWHETPVMKAIGVPRIALSLLVTALGVTLAARTDPWRTLYDQGRLQVSVWAPAEAAKSTGAIAYFLVMLQSTRFALPEPDPAALAAFAREFPDANTAMTRVEGTPDAANVDIIVLQSESFFDPDDLVGLNSQTLIPNLVSLRQQHAHGRLQVPTFGGLTTRTEFEFLTGYPLQTAPAVQYPFQGLVHRAMPALPWILKRHGYSTHALHPYDRRFYARDRVYPRLGFDVFHSRPEFSAADVHGYFVSDDALGLRIRQLLSEEGANFVFAVSMENHGPWGVGRLPDGTALPGIPEQPGMGADAALSLRQFLHHLQRADAALGELARWVLQRERPTVLLFYGDHLPNLVDVYEHWSWRDARPTNQQTVPWLLVDNRHAAAEQADMSSAELAALLLDRVGIRDDPLFVAIQHLRTRSADVATDRRMWLQQHLAAHQLAQPMSEHAQDFATAEVAKVRAWSPGSAEQNRDPTTRIGVWVQFEQAPPIAAYLTLGDRRMQIYSRDDAVLSAALEPPLAAGLLSTPGRYPLRLVDPVRVVHQQIGELVVRERAQRLGSVLGFGGGPFCRVLDWGPQTTSAASPANLLHDGSIGLWINAECLPSDVTVTAAEQPLATETVDQLATALLPAEWLLEGQSVAISLMLPDGQHLPVGILQVTP